MRAMKRIGIGLFLALCLWTGCSRTPPGAEHTAARRPAAVDAARLLHADSEPGNWMTTGRTYSEQRFSPLARINAQNVRQLGLAWPFNLDTRRGQETTPLVIDGAMYFTTAWSTVVALDAATGLPVWETLTIDPSSRYTITGAPRLVRGKVLIGNGGAEMSVRGYISAYDAETGKLAWRFYTIPGDPSKPFENPALEKAAKGGQASSAARKP